MEKFRKTLRTGKGVSKWHRDYILIKELFHCTPSDLEEQEEYKLDLYYNMLMIEREEGIIEQKRQEQKNKSKFLSQKKR